MTCFFAGFLGCVALVALAELVLVTLGEPLPARRGSVWPVLSLLAPLELTVQAATTAAWVLASCLYLCDPTLWWWMHQIRKCAGEDGVITLRHWCVRDVSAGLRGVRMVRVPPKSGLWKGDHVWHGHPLWRERTRALEAARLATALETCPHHTPATETTP